jgi:hypothetical protein
MEPPAFAAGITGREYDAINPDVFQIVAVPNSRALRYDTALNG